MQRAIIKLSALGALVLGAACATPSLDPLSLTPDPGSLKVDVDDEKLGTKDLIVIKDEYKVLVHPSTQFGFALHTQVHQIVKVMTPAGVDIVANQKISAGARTRLQLQARTIAPDGSVHELTPEQVFADEAKAAQTGSRWDTTAFRFPRVEVGSIVEFIMETRGPGGAGWSSSDVSERKDSLLTEGKVELTLHPSIRYRLRAYNFEPEVTTSMWGDYRRLTFPAMEFSKEVPPIPYAPADQFRQKRMDLSVTQIAGRGFTQDIATTWADVVKRDAGALNYDHRTRLVDAPPWALNASCVDTACWIQAALMEARAKTELTDLGGSVGGSRSFKDMFASGEASGYERAFHVFKLLQSVGVDATYALTTRRNTNALDKSAPNAGVFNHLVLSVMDGDKEIWIDPTCDFCAVGEMPDRTRGVPALKLKATYRAFLSSEAESDWTTTGGKAVAPATEENSYALNLHENGDVDVVATRVATGEIAQAWIMEERNKTAPERREAARKWAEGVFPTAELIGTQAPVCDAAKMRCEQKQTMRLANFLVQDQGNVLLRSAIFDNTELLKKGERSVDIVFDRSATHATNLRIAYPKAWTLKAKAKTGSKKSEATRFKTRWGMDGKELVINREIAFDAGWFKADKIEDLAAPFEAYKSDRRKVVSFAGRINNGKAAPPPPAPEPPPAATPVSPEPVNPDKVDDDPAPAKPAPAKPAPAPAPPAKPAPTPAPAG